jgi:hypothetical protein
MDELVTCPNCKRPRRLVHLVSAPNGNDTTDLLVCDDCKTVDTYMVGRLLGSPFEPDLDAESQAEADKLADYAAAPA